MRSRESCVWPLLFAAGLFMGCSAQKTYPTDRGPGPAHDGYPPAISADSALSALRMAYVSKNLDEYMSLFADSFKFVVSPGDLGRDPSLPASWPLDTERQIHDHMFHRDDVEQISLSFNSPYPAVPDSTTVPGQHLWKVRLDGIRLDVIVRTSSEPIDYQVTSGTGAFYFQVDAAHPIQGQPAWKIVLWQDEPIGADPASNETAFHVLSWGFIKSQFLLQR